LNHMKNLERLDSAQLAVIQRGRATALITLLITHIMSYFVGGPSIPTFRGVWELSRRAEV